MLILAVFCVFIGIMVFWGAKDRIKIERRCTKTVRAKCIDHVPIRISTGKRNERSDHLEYRTLYEFDYEGNTYKVQSHELTRVPKVQIGQECDIKINPNQPQEIFTGMEKQSSKSNRILGIIFILVGILFLIMWMLKVVG